MTYSATSLAQNQRPAADPIVLQIIELDYADAEDLARVLTPFLSRDGRISAYSQNQIFNLLNIKTQIYQTGRQAWHR